VDRDAIRLTVDGLLVLDAERDRLALIRLRVAVRADFDRSAMIYTAADLARWIERAMERRGHRLTVVAEGDGLRVIDGDPSAVAIVQRATQTGSFEAAGAQVP
jgi:hypothetical protein